MHKLVLLFAIVVLSQAAQAGPTERLIRALIQIESSDNDMAIGDTRKKEHAYGCLQIRQPVCDDVNRRYKTSFVSKQCLGNRRLSVEICKKYLSMYGKNRSEYELARIWNGGPNGFRHSCTESYGAKVQKVLSRSK